MIIYKATNTVNDKVYIGKTTQTFHERQSKHKSNVDKPRYSHVVFYKAIRKYEWNSFVWEVIDTATTNDELNEKEMYWINYYRAYVGFKDCNGYNSTLGGDGLNGWNHSEETKEKVRQANLGKKYPESHKKMLSEMHKQRIKDNPHQVARGEQQSSSKLTDQKVKEIIEHLNEKTYKIIELAMMYDVDRRTIDSIKRGTSWTHIERESIASYNIGSNHHSSKLTENDVLEIKKKLKEGNYSTLTSLAKEFGITVQSLHKIKTGKSWSHIAI